MAWSRCKTTNRLMMIIMTCKKSEWVSEWVSEWERERERKRERKKERKKERKVCITGIFPLNYLTAVQAEI